MVGENEEVLHNLVRLSSVINSSLDINEVLERSMRFVEEMMNAEASSIFELDAERDELAFRVARDGPEAKTKEIRMKMGEGVVGWVARSGEPLLVPDTSREERFSDKVDRHTGFRTRSLVALPIRNRGRIVGALGEVDEEVDFGDLSIAFAGTTVARNGIGVVVDEDAVSAAMSGDFGVTVSVGNGQGTARVFTTDLTPDYVRFNAERS